MADDSSVIPGSSTPPQQTPQQGGPRYDQNPFPHVERGSVPGTPNERAPQPPIVPA